MTSQLRRKRPITARSTLATARPNGLLLKSCAVAVGLMISVASSQAADEMVQRADFESSPDQPDNMVRQVVYTTGSQGGKLAWLPYRPDQAPPRVPRPEHMASTTATPPVRLAPASTPPTRLTSNSSGSTPVRPAVLTPMANPFNDPPLVAQTPLLTKPLSDRILDGSAPTEVPPSIPVLPQLGVAPPEDVEEPMSIEQRFADSSQPPTVDCRDASEVLKDIQDITHDIASPESLVPVECPLGYDEPDRPDWYLHRSWAPTTFQWKASALCHKPSYFEDVQLERYGHSWGPYVQPIVSGAHFFLTVPVLPYKMGLYPPNECMYTLGYYRTGSCAPYMLDPIPLSARAALMQAGAVVGAAAIIP